MSKPRGLNVLPEAPPETATQDTTGPQPPGYTLADQVRRNAALVRALADEFDIDPTAVVTLFATTMNIHFTKIQLGLTAPVEG